MVKVLNAHRKIKSTTSWPRTLTVAEAAAAKLRADAQAQRQARPQLPGHSMTVYVRPPAIKNAMPPKKKHKRKRKVEQKRKTANFRAYKPGITGLTSTRWVKHGAKGEKRQWNQLVQNLQLKPNNKAKANKATAANKPAANKAKANVVR